jgi:hypothetical protein
MIAYNYHPQTGVFLGQFEADESPLEPGIFILPANATFQAPPSAQERKQIVWVGQGWEVQDIPIEPAPPVPEPQPIEPAPPVPEPQPITWDDIRNERNGRLMTSDWTQLADAPLSEENVEAWRDHRQQLRDIPASALAPEDVVWPSPPA